MRFVSYLTDDTPGYGIVTDAGGVVQLNGRLPHADLRALIASGSISDIVQTVETTVRGLSADFDLAGITLVSPVPHPEKIWCIGVNYTGRNAEYKDGSDQPKYPSLFCRAASSLVGHEVPLVRPKVSEQLDYEGEIVIVIGREGRHIPRERAFEHVFGLTLGNEGSVRDWLKHGKFNVTQGKNFDRSGSVGPWIVTSDECHPSAALSIETRVNGEQRQSDTTESLAFPFDYIIEYLSTFATLKPGDMIFTGTPTGTGARFDPPIWLKPGDVIEVEVPGIGILSNNVADEE
jgi:2-keto-4-pentenoate hydratase/2-oxohepta-3-ene-1,7-dioic acid hydratase in catechol pathway|tara:strand:- start:63887 stop:64756 length:870 start_codon:yes stop_codon:yes gene_type:complete